MRVNIQLVKADKNDLKKLSKHFKSVQKNF